MLISLQSFDVGNIACVRVGSEVSDLVPNDSGTETWLSHVFLTV